MQRGTQQTAIDAMASEPDVPVAGEIVGLSAHQRPNQEGITLRVAVSFEDLPLGRAEWDNAVASLGGSVYMTWDWIRTWWEFYGNGCELRLMACFAGERIVGLFPLYIDVFGLWPLKLRIARLVGANIPPKLFDPPVNPEWASDCFDAVIRRLIEADRCDLVSVGPLSSTSQAWRSLPHESKLTKGVARIERRNSGAHTLFLLPASHGEYIESLCRNRQKNRRRYELRELKKEHDVKVEVISGPPEALLREFDDFASLHAAQWRTEGRFGHFGSWPRGLAYNRALVKALGPLGRLRFVRITADGVTVACQYVFAFAGRWYWELPARLPGPRWDRFSLGPIGAVTMIGEAIREGVHWIQGGMGHYDYKLRLQASEYPVFRVRAYPSRLAARVRMGVFECVRWTLCLCYHKIWYRRVMFRLPAPFRHSQWTVWLRWDF
jgi:CelD/BcsL family acetyltransferase involved in cellulose biosynthesis